MHPRAWLARLVPTRHSLAIGLAILGVAIGGYLIARQTSLFAIDTIEVHGGSATVARQVREALAPIVGKPLVGLDGSSVLERVESLPTVVSATYDRDFPHTLRVTVVPERPAAVLRRGADSWLVSTRGRVMERLASRAVPHLPRIWISSHTHVLTGGQVSGAGTATVARAAGFAGAFASRIVSATYTHGTLVFRLRSGLELLLGDPRDVKLKLAVAQRVLPVLPADSTFLDVSIPGRPVSGAGSPSVSTASTSSGG